MKTKYLVRTAAVLLATLSFAQEEENMRRLEFSAHYGIYGNFFVTSFDEQQPSSYYGKDFIGSIGGVEVVWNLKDNKQAFGLSFDQSVNLGKKNITQTSNNNLIKVENFNLKHLNKMYGIFYRRNMGSKFTASVGFYLFSEVDQNMDLDAQNNFIMLREYSSIEGGFFLGSDYYFYKRSDFEIGVQFKLFSYFAISEFDIEAISLSPKIRFFF